jgi:glycosyltransferase involved in cell wall biosynthesis
MSDYSVIIPAHNAARTLPLVLAALDRQDPAPAEVIVVDDSSSDETGALAEEAGARVIRPQEAVYAGGARNRGWEQARTDSIVFLDADAVPEDGWGAGVERAIREFPGAIVGGARTFRGDTPWSWVAHLQIETPYLPVGDPREVKFVASYCMALPRDLTVRFDSSYGGEDALFSADALAAGVPLVFDPRFSAVHHRDRRTLRSLRSEQRRLAYGMARCGAVQQEGLYKRILWRVPVHHFLLLRLPLVYRRVEGDAELRRQFVRLLPRLAVAEWLLGISMLRYVFKRPALRGTAVERLRTAA